MDRDIPHGDKGRGTDELMAKKFVFKTTYSRVSWDDHVENKGIYFLSRSLGQKSEFYNVILIKKMLVFYEAFFSFKEKNH